jgi:hypothetical protein
MRPSVEGSPRTMIPTRLRTSLKTMRNAGRARSSWLFWCMRLCFLRFHPTSSCLTSNLKSQTSSPSKLCPMKLRNRTLNPCQRSTWLRPLFLFPPARRDLAPHRRHRTQSQNPNQSLPRSRSLSQSLFQTQFQNRSLSLSQNRFQSQSQSPSPSPRLRHRPKYCLNRLLNRNLRSCLFQSLL